ncbi:MULTISPECIES: hypothetical protein [unclassified Streptomyces]|uniref:hypothetical protein n=1 Tax=unclassified Streptomyces TaxID=2593676 RepID=UPI0036A90F43
MMRTKKRKPTRWQYAAVLGLVGLLTGMIGTAASVGADAGARTGHHVAAWNSTGSSCSTCTVTS